MVARGWPRARAETYELLRSCANALGRALRERDPCYAASTYAICDALFSQQASLENKDLPPRLYAHQRGRHSLVEKEPAWEGLETPDGTGFRGLTSAALVLVGRNPQRFTEEGYAVPVQRDRRTVSSSGHYPAATVGPEAIAPWETLMMYRQGQHAAFNLSEVAPSDVDRLFAWTDALRGRTVLVVHPFNTSIASQLAGRASVMPRLWGPWAERVMPSALRVKVVVPPQNLAMNNESQHWRQAFDTLVRRVDAAGSFDLALLGCGGLGMLLGSHLRASGRSSIYVGGALQLWFGVYGERWSRFVGAEGRASGSGWVRPRPSEAPTGSKMVEGKGHAAGAYW